MLTFPNCKINLGLRILDRREDGYHNLESIFLPVQWRDVLEVIEAKEFSIVTAGIKVEGKPEENTCVKAYNLLKEKFNIPPVKIILQKNIPTGAGLGGGSSDGAFMLKLLNDKFNLKITNDELKKYAALLGSDCPFFIDNKPAYVTGRGEVMEEIALPLHGYYLVIIYPEASVNTSWAYAELAKQRKAAGLLSYPSGSLKEAIQRPVTEWKNFFKNDFEEIIFPSFPIIREAKEKLMQAGADFACMSGSGAAVFGLFKNKEKALNSLSFSLKKENIYISQII